MDPRVPAVLPVPEVLEELGVPEGQRVAVLVEGQPAVRMWGGP